MSQGSLTDTQAFRELISLTSALATERDLQVLLQRILDGALSIVGADGGAIYLLDSTKRNLVVEVFEFISRDTRRSDFAMTPLIVEGQRNTRKTSVQCAFSGKTIAIDDVYEYSGYDFSDIYQFDELTAYRTRSMLNVPLIDHQGVTVGVMQLFNAQGEAGGKKVVPFSDDAQSIALSFASQAAIAIENVQLLTENEHLIRMLNQSNEKLEEENQRLRKTIEGSHDFSQIIGDSDALRKTFDLMKKVMHSDATVLVTGETGTGKELIASAIHFNSHRKSKTFVAQNCSALPADLLESELFGYVKGAFSGAVADKIGLIEQADGGSLFLDEIGDMPLNLQAKILRVLQEKELRPLGAVKTRKVNVRIIAATHKNLKEMVNESTFREDLYYRLAVFPIGLPALRERAEDLPALVAHFMSNFAEKYGKFVQGLSPKALDYLSRYAYPGNIRELRNAIERAVLLVEDGSYITPDHLPEEIFDRRSADGRASRRISAQVMDGSLKELVERFEAELIENKLQEFNWNQTQTARELDVGRRTLIDKINRYGLKLDA